MILSFGNLYISTMEHGVFTAELEVADPDLDPDPDPDPEEYTITFPLILRDEK